ncbi:ABC transporter permease [Streptomyces sp. HPF1205]|uniref:ABC transporter permease n=1 Tax=Streptomyces sp. HPF1205 TaxID=2873262 RepID=UPI0021F0AC71|nr:ABC transporter permease [Streptomyces sp. HPF1205]
MNRLVRLGLRLTLGGGKEAAARLAVITAAVALGVGMLLSTLAALNATGTQNDRYAWLNTAVGDDPRPAATARPDADPLWWMLRADGFRGKLIGRLDVAATGPRSPVPPGIPRLPGPGEFYASPALARLLATTPAAQLADRYPGHRVGTIGDVALPGPDSLIIVIGHRPDELSGNRMAQRVTSITTTSPSRCDGSNCEVAGTDSSGMDLILSVVSGALIFPVLVLIATATRLSATRREQRYAAMRLIGATPRQISVISAVESTLAATAGVAANFALFFPIRPLLRQVNFTRTPFFLGDLSLTPADVLLVGLGVPVAAAVSAWIALRRVRISPLGVTRRVTPRPPRAYRLVPLVAGLLEIAWFIGRDPSTSGGQVRAFLPGMLLVMGGIVLAGPWLTMVGAAFMARRTGRPAPLVAGRRLSDDPKAGFRAVSGLVLALCVTSGAVGIITSMVAERGIPQGGPQVRHTVVGDYIDYSHYDDRLTGTAASPSDALLGRLRSVPGVLGVTVVHEDPHFTRRQGGDGFGGGLASCVQLATTPVFGACPPGAETAAVAADFAGIGFQDPDRPWPTVWHAAAAGPDGLQRLPALQVVVVTDGSTRAEEQARTLLATAYPDQRVPYTLAEDRARASQELDGYKQLADVVVAVSFPVAGCSLAVSVAGGLSDRRRPFSLLRLTGVRLGVLRRVVLLESAVPLVVVSAVAIATGFLAAHLFLKAQLGYSLRAPGGEYYLIVGGGLAAALAVIASTLPLLRRITAPETVRNE